ncbi:BaiN/RdsA family NAD(P)/FAD-dependent oxidoreductase [Sphingopyxis yananensis]|uniref:NAD(P)/FAD-dependent oxidoreductase n=1 Tax=Sphingopyxis yananensis TaxID=2886687 RepID=UPI001D0F60B7|nr:NAD(P)/FAD-dependent oxidoreductase [Sphingopyxis yananensis]MCC2602596.1 NAD(P)/FAD-dependent oxidoreductase [Sphingopyxis yananensis]
MTPANHYDAIVLGAGAAGLMCAATAGQRGKRVLLLDHADQVGKKILISGGGRCNFTNIHARPENYISANPHFVKSALARYTPADFIEMVDAYGIAYNEKTLGQLFCDGSAKQIVAMLMEECAKGQVDIRLGHDVRDVQYADEIYCLTFGPSRFTADALVIATGGPSIPKMGATGFAYDLARQFGVKIVEPRPALVPLTLGGDDVLFRDISGVAAPVEASSGKTSFREAALFTHRGLSGPVILQISSYWKSGESIAINFLPDTEKDWLVAAKQARPRAQFSTIMGQMWPDRLAQILVQRLGLNGELSTITDAKLRDAEAKLRRWTFHPNGTEGYAKAEVTVGGIATAALSSQTMMVKAVKNLYAVGEAVDVTGWLGGYNFQWAWASGYAAGQAI